MRARGQRDDFRAAGVDGEEFEDVAAAVVSGELGGVDRLEDLCVYVGGWVGGVWSACGPYGRRGLRLSFADEKKMKRVLVCVCC